MHSLIVASAIVLTGIALGRSLLGWAGYHPYGTAETIALSGGLGLGLLSYAVLGIGLLGWLYPGGILGLLGTALLIGYRGLFATLVDVWRWLRKLARWRPQPWQSVLIGLLVAFLLLSLLGALAPPTEADAMFYHLAVPAIYVRAHQVVDVPYNFFSYLPFGLEMLYTAGLVLDSSGIVAALVHYGYGVLTLLAILALGKRYFSPTVGLWGVLFFISVPLVIPQMSIPQVDLGPTLYFTLAVLALLRWWESQALRWSLLAGVFAGLAIGAKLQLLLLVTTLGVVFVAACLVKGQKKPLARRMGSVLAFGLLAILVASPWFLKNWCYTGNPVYPQLYGVFGGSNLNPPLAQLIEQHFKSHAPGGYDLATFLITPWLLFHSGRVNVGYFVFAFVPFALGWRSRRSLWWAAASVAGVYYPLWFSFHIHHPRYLIYLLPVLSVLAAAGLSWLLTAAPIQQWARRTVQGSVIFGLVALLGLTLIYQRKAIPVALGLESREVYLDKYGYVQEPYRWAKTNLPPGSRVLVRNLWDMTYYLEVDYVLGSPFIQGVIDYTRMQDWQDLAGRTAELGITHVFLASTDPSAQQTTETSDNAGQPPPDLYLRSMALCWEMVANCGQEIARFDYQMNYGRTLGTEQVPVVIHLYLLDWHGPGCEQ